MTNNNNHFPQSDAIDIDGYLGIECSTCQKKQILLFEEGRLKFLDVFYFLLLLGILLFLGVVLKNQHVNYKEDKAASAAEEELEKMPEVIKAEIFKDPISGLWAGYALPFERLCYRDSYIAVKEALYQQIIRSSNHSIGTKSRYKIEEEGFMIDGNWHIISLDLKQGLWYGILDEKAPGIGAYKLEAVLKKLIEL